jgi:hypothetical protein
MKYREVRRRIRLLRNCGYMRVKRLEWQGMFKEWHYQDHHIRTVCPYEIMFGDYWELIRFLHHEEQRAQQLLREEHQIFLEGGL